MNAKLQPCCICVPARRRDLCLRTCARAQVALRSTAVFLDWNRHRICEGGSMDSTRGRPASAAERRNNAGSTTPSRANSTQAGRYEGHAENGSFIPASETNGDHKNVSERRKERTTVTTTEKLTRRSPVKDSMSAGNRVSTDRYGRASPTLLRRQKESRPGNFTPLSLAR